MVRLHEEEDKAFPILQLTQVTSLGITWPVENGNKTLKRQQPMDGDNDH